MFINEILAKTLTDSAGFPVTPRSDYRVTTRGVRTLAAVSQGVLHITRNDKLSMELTCSRLTRVC
jgi:hypothetical protein